MGFYWATLLKDLRRYRRNPAEPLLWIGIPLLIGGLIIAASGGRGGPAPQAHLLVVDEDDTFLSGMLVGTLSQDEMGGGLIRAEEVAEEAAGRQQVAAGRATALLIIPAGFGTGFLEQQPVTLQLLTNPAQRILPGIVQESLSILVDGGFYLQQLLGDELRTIAEGPPPGASTLEDMLVSNMAVRINGIVRRLRRYLDPVLIKLKVVQPPTEQASTPGFALFFVPGILFMGLLFMAQGMGDELWHERQDHTLRRILSTPRRLEIFLVGKITAGALLMLLVCLVGLAVGYLYFGLPFWTFPAAVAWAVLAGVMLMGLMSLIQLHASSQRGGNLLTMILIFPLMMVGGSFFPFETMPAWMAHVGHLTPNGWALEILKDILRGEITPGRLALSFAVLLAIGGLLHVLSARRLAGGFVGR
jgi:ABC-type Na+ efflux pump permease subunit